MNPTISVLLPAYNSEKYIGEAVESILNQTFTDFELIVLDDASTDRTPDILAEYALKDTRIRVVRNESNLRIAASLNRGITLASGKYIARMDADDAAVPERFEKQFELMEKNPDIAVCGSWVSVYETGEEWRPPSDSDSIKAKLFFESYLYHPAVMIRKDVLVSYAGGYRPDMPPAEDYDLWVRLAVHPEVKFANVPQVLLRYRMHPGVDREIYREKQLESSNRVRRFLLSHIGLEVSDEEFQVHVALSVRWNIFQKALPGRCRRWMEKMAAAVRNSAYCSEAALKKESAICYRMLMRQRLKDFIFPRNSRARLAAKAMKHWIAGLAGK